MNVVKHFALHPTNAVRNLIFRIPRGKSSKTLVFILGVPRSGTTLLKTNLVAHSALCGSDYESTGILGWRDIFAYRMGDIPPEEIDEYLLLSKDIVSFYENIVARISVDKGKPLFVDKLQMRRLRIVYVAYFFPNSYFVHIVRDGRDCYCSALNHPNVPQSETLERFARYWSDSVMLPETILPPERLLEVRYEDLVSRPDETLTSLMDHLGLEFESRQVDVDVYANTTSIKKRDVHANLNNPINTSSIARWKRDLKPSENESFIRIAGDTLSKHGYSLT